MPKGSWREFDDPQKTALTNQTPSNTSQSERKVRVQKMRNGKKGKTVTIISGLELAQDELRELLKTLKTKCSTGGTVKESYIELQGDHVAITLAMLLKKGYQPKKSGG